jgi:hypothetical protein
MLRIEHDIQNEVMQYTNEIFAFKVRPKAEIFLLYIDELQPPTCQKASQISTRERR